MSKSLQWNIMCRILSQLLNLILILIYISDCTKYDKCDITVDSAICIKNVEKILLPNAKRMGRILYMTFDENEPVDSSGYGNHGIGDVYGHSGFGGVGTSGYFRKNFVYLKSTDSFMSYEFSYLFFIYLLMDQEAHENSLKYDNFCPVLHKGYKTNLANEAAPEISINPKDGQIKVAISVQGDKTIELTSNSRLRYHHWYHISLVKDKAHVLLYVDGILDCVYATNAILRLNTLPLYIGNTPFSPNCDFPLLIDQLSIFGHAVGADEIQAEASIALGGVESSYIMIGCTNCSKDEAKTSCPEGYHLCNKFELYTGGYQIARKLSLPSSDIMAAASAEPSSGIGLCCINLQN